ncbi:DMT family transporter [Limibaculum sp. FT325]|uniref:EamA family transporter n=1 Tax=Thermohalobaculum sediminis TaxID=2939436 RepID=UPI0020BFC6C1|nr:EamA family transporter [Limibaculum sediminis]MCL5776455.1 DMT family transporter [Limibaculum sediminis]
MSEMIVTMAGTPEGGVLALALALLSAFAHATFGAINKGGADPYLNRGAINAAYSLMAMPFAFFVFPLPSAAVWQVLALTYLIHLLYEWLQSTAFHKGDFTLVYPIARGTGPLATAVGAVFIFGERLGPVQWAGLALLSASIWGLAAANLRARRVDIAALHGLRQAIGVALMTGGMIAVYTIVDAYGIRLAENPFTFLAWFFVLGGFGFPFVALHRWRTMPPERRPEPFDLAVRGVFGAIIAFVSFGAIMLATRLDKVGEAAALRETSIIFATAIGVLVFRERIDALRLGLIGLIATGAMLVEFG